MTMSLPSLAPAATRALGWMFAPPIWIAPGALCEAPTARRPAPLQRSAVAVQHVSVDVIYQGHRHFAGFRLYHDRPAEISFPALKQQLAGGVFLEQHWTGR